MQAQMTPATAPGIAGLMQGKPQGGPNPMQPMPASPGSVNQIKDMYGTKTVPRDMKALLALNEALAQVKSAENQNALQQQIPQQNIKEQMSSEAQNILQQAQGVTGASQQQEQQKQAALQRLAQGIARAPGADQVMPQRMAGGGIVAFQNRGEVPFPGYQDPDVDENGNPRSQSDRARIMRMNAALQARSKKYLSAPELYSDPVMTGETYRFLRNRLEEFPPTGPRGGPGFVREGDRAVLETLAQAEEPPVQPDTMQAQMPEPPQAPQQPPMRMPPAQGQSKVPVQGAPAALEKPAMGNITPGGVISSAPEPPPM